MGGNKRTTALYVGICILAGIVAVAFVFWSHAWTEERAEAAKARAEAAQEQAAAQSSLVEVSNPQAIPVVSGEEDLLEEGLTSFLTANGIDAQAADLVADPGGRREVFYASASGSLVRIEHHANAAARFSFSLCEDPVPGINAPMEEEAPGDGKQEGQEDEEKGGRDGRG